jgi:hypothetical protein
LWSIGYSLKVTVTTQAAPFLDEAMAENGHAEQRMVKAIRRLPALAEFYEGVS